MRAISVFLTAALVISSPSSMPALAGAAVPVDSDLARLQGRWTARAGAHREIRVTLQIHETRADVAIATPQGLRINVRGEVKLDNSTLPHRVDWIKFTGADQQQFPLIPGIYSLEQNQFTVCTGGLNGSRPREFKAGDGVLTEVVTFRREPVSASSEQSPNLNSKVPNHKPKSPNK
jgi:uncharacterized protein (TIGR03067 family)